VAELATARTKGKQPTDQQIERDRGTGSFELGDAQLPRTEAGQSSMQDPPSQLPVQINMLA
jgi:hypothetical protein